MTCPSGLSCGFSKGTRKGASHDENMQNLLLRHENQQMFVGSLIEQNYTRISVRLQLINQYNIIILAGIMGREFILIEVSEKMPSLGGFRLILPIDDSHLRRSAPLGLQLDQSLLVHLTEDSPLLTARDTELEAFLVGD